MKEKRRSLLLMGSLVILALLNALTPVRGFSPKENRYLQTFPLLSVPQVFSGAFGREYEVFSTDQFLFRDGWTGLKTLTDRILGKKDNGRVYFGEKDHLFAVPEELSPERFAANLSALVKFQERVGELLPHTTLSALLVPDKATVLPELLPAYAPVTEEKKLFQQIQRELEGLFTLVDLQEIFQGFPQEDLYYRTDHHWTTEGAYLAYGAYRRALGETPKPWKEAERQVVTQEFFGTLQRKAGLYLGPPDVIEAMALPEDFPLRVTGEEGKVIPLYEKNFLEKTDKYAYFFGGDHARMEITAEVPQRKTLLVVKDSFANSLLPFLARDYARIVVLDLRYYGPAVLDAVKDVEPDEILFLYGLQNFTQQAQLSLLGRE